MQNTLMVWDTVEERFDVTVGGEWVGWVWSDQRHWFAMTSDGDGEPGFSNFLSAAMFCRVMWENWQ